MTDSICGKPDSHKSYTRSFGECPFCDKIELQRFREKAAKDGNREELVRGLRILREAAGRFHKEATDQGARPFPDYLVDAVKLADRLTGEGEWGSKDQPAGALRLTEGGSHPSSGVATDPRLSVRSGDPGSNPGSPICRKCGKPATRGAITLSGDLDYTGWWCDEHGPSPLTTPTKSTAGLYPDPLPPHFVQPSKCERCQGKRWVPCTACGAGGTVCCCRGDVYCGDDCKGCTVHGPLCQVDGDHDAKNAGIRHVCTKCFWEAVWNLGSHVGQKQVRGWHEAMGIYVADKPSIPPGNIIETRIILARGETEELVEALTDGDLERVADAIADRLFENYGTAVSCGLNAKPLFDEVVRSNYTKDPPGPDGKARKGSKYSPPNLKPIIEAQMQAAEKAGGQSQ